MSITQTILEMPETELDFDRFLANMNPEELYRVWSPPHESQEAASSPNSSSLAFDEQELPDLSVLAYDVLQSAPAEEISLENENPSTPEVQTSPVQVKEEPKRRTSPPTNKRAQKKPKITEVIEIKPEKDDKYQKRLAANKKSAQASRERKKALRSELEAKFDSLQSENASLSKQITELETENKVLKGEFANLQNLITQSAHLSKLMEKANMNAPIISLPPTIRDNSAAALYLMIVLKAFGHYFTSTSINTYGPVVNEVRPSSPVQEVM